MNVRNRDNTPTIQLPFARSRTAAVGDTLREIVATDPLGQYTRARVARFVDERKEQSK